MSWQLYEMLGGEGNLRWTAIPTRGEYEYDVESSYEIQDKLPLAAYNTKS